MMSIDELCYRLYKIDWLERIGTERRLEVLRDYFEEGEGEPYSEYFDERGYQGEIYAGYEEFLDNEFKDEEYMDSLLKREGLKEHYHEYINQMEREL